jgi:hypothetical protein
VSAAVELVQARRFIERAPWRFAKTMASIPHEYVVESKVDDPEGFALFVAYIAKHGYPARWRHLPPNRYLELDGWRYWTMRPVNGAVATRTC